MQTLAPSTQVAITENADLEVLQSALLRHLWVTMGASDGSPVEGSLFDAADVTLGRSGQTALADAIDELDEHLRSVRALHDALKLLSGARVGQTAELPLYPSDLAEILDDVRGNVEDYATSGYVDGGFWNQPPPAQARLLANRNAAMRLRSSLAEPRDLNIRVIRTSEPTAARIGA